MKFALFLLIFVGELSSSVLGVKILMLANLMKSHMMEVVPITEELIARNHTAYTVVPSTSKSHIKNLQKRGINVIQFPASSDEEYMDSPVYNKIIAQNTFKSQDLLAKYKEFRKAAILGSNHCYKILENENIMSQLRRINFDIAVVDTFIINLCLLIVPKILQIPYISVSSTIPLVLIGSPAFPSFVPTLLQNAGEEMTFYERLQSFSIHMVMFSPYISVDHGSEIIEEYAPQTGMTSWIELYKASIFFVQLRDHMLEWPTPMTPHMSMLPGISYSEVKRLPIGLDTIMNKAEKGVILVSFGSTAGYLPSDIVKDMAEGFKNIKGYQFIWKFPISEYYDLVKALDILPNIHMFDWLPQNDILGHNKTKLFITHCGNNGQYEALYHAVPMVGFPMFAEQHHNCYRMKAHGYGLCMDIKSFKSDELERNINMVLGNDELHAKIKLASKILKDRIHPKIEAANQIEHVIKFGASHLRGASIDIPTYQFLMLDILTFIISVLLTTIFLIVCIVKCAYNYWLKKKLNKNKKE